MQTVSWQGFGWDDEIKERCPILVEASTSVEAWEWAQQHFGPAYATMRGLSFVIRPDATWGAISNRFYFKTEDDAFLFKLHWG